MFGKANQSVPPPGRRANKGEEKRAAGRKWRAGGCAEGISAGRYFSLAKMGEPQQVSALPPPPMQYIKEYTDENIRKGLAPKPPPPVKDSYMMFGNQFQCDDLIIRPLESQGIERLHPMQFDHKKELRKLNMSILVNFLDLLDILIRSPGSIKREEKLEDLKLLFVHVHHLINEYRPHQARETLRVMMEVQKRQRLETAERFQKHLERVVEMIQNCLASLPDDLPHSEGGLRVKVETMDADDGSSCTGQSEKQRERSGGKRDQVLDKDAAMCSIIDEMT
ncbi:mediator of RNA polymerase II transcription subunit 7 [Patagioenas fasciata monilis]|uniref:Mediator of RNA polymerase II transcription subunit 7 n=2 Tax=Columbidae TaxID=8930 RepID=A0A1V4KUQ1_PATFA|nr:mediator of RNA polymerase II transcription subunit 7 [Patagioenas fasciata monilis]